jgi:hypothetical protein
LALGAVILACAVMLSAAAVDAHDAAAGTRPPRRRPPVRTRLSRQLAHADYLMASMEGDLFEILGGKPALKKSHTPAVDALATRLIKDHPKSYEAADEIKDGSNADVISGARQDLPMLTMHLKLSKPLCGRSGSDGSRRAGPLNAEGRETIASRPSGRCL